MVRLLNTNETPEEAEARRRAATARRIKILVFLSVGVVVARTFISDPKRKAPIDYTKSRQIKIVPGMLDTMPAASRAALDPQVVSKMVLADEMARRGVTTLDSAPPLPTGTYKVADAPLEKDLEADLYKEQVFAYARKRRIETERQRRDEQPVDLGNSTLVQFRSGGYVLAEAAQQRPDETYIRMSKTVEADFPSHWVSSIRKNVQGWQEPVPPGQVRLKPAKGITVIMHRDTAARVTVVKTKVDEI